ncbi:NAD+ synthase [Thermaerobacter subterraneus]|uniref:Glutamine-dependent NAD(+) synthetase n=1 Tax=Thermaerobacter subterraneus DSM 13965 TaxID=867903 RepID=K6QCG0_9FIRM|nr:NAD+ synthase [Thermaerobacter subterraneus]EKP94206.1 NAD+ synthetase [Thermaerobacter subterraneus DSM 13965]
MDPAAAPLRIAVAQVNVTVGDLEGNARKLARFAADAAQTGADLVVFPELALTGYPPEDLVFRPAFLDATRHWLGWLAGELAAGPVALVGFVHRDRDLYNAAAVLQGGQIKAVACKRFLPNYGVFDEKRYFAPGRRALVLHLRGVALGVSICEDLWYPHGPIREQALAGGAEILLNLSASPYHMGKPREREGLLITRATDLGVAIVYANLVGGQDELVFDGHSLVVDAGGQVAARGRPFAEDLFFWDYDPAAAAVARWHEPRYRHMPVTPEEAAQVEHVDLDEPAAGGGPGGRLPGPVAGPGVAVPGVAGPGTAPEASRPPLPPRQVEVLEGEAEVYAALVLALRDYFEKNGFRRAWLGLSGGIDSALVACLAADALGPRQVTGVRMPSPFTSAASLDDAEAVARNLGIGLETIPIGEIFGAFRQALAPLFGDRPFDVAEENLQARIRGTLLMALANKFGGLVLATGNKSELATGYATLYGDMAGGFAPLKDVPKTLVYRLAAYRNGWPGGPVIPRSVLEKAPTAELRPGQKDEDSLPPYAVLDPILEAYVERDLPAAALVARGLPAEAVRRTVHLVATSEYKRRQAAPGPKITARAFGRDRRYPITSGYREAVPGDGGSAG